MTITSSARRTTKAAVPQYSAWPEAYRRAYVGELTGIVNSLLIEMGDRVLDLRERAAPHL